MIDERRSNRQCDKSRTTLADGDAGDRRTGQTPGDMTVRVLLCDDHAMVREGLERLVNSHEGIEVVGTAADGEEAVRQAVELRPDVVMMDVSMPRLDGIEATRRIVAS